jgi:hypothetical protein
VPSRYQPHLVYAAAKSNGVVKHFEEKDRDESIQIKNKIMCLMRSVAL